MINDFCCKREIPLINVGYLNDISVIGPFYIPYIKNSCCLCCDKPIYLENNIENHKVNEINRRVKAPSALINNFFSGAMLGSELIKFFSKDYNKMQSINTVLGIHNKDFKLEKITIDKNSHCLYCGGKDDKNYDKIIISYVSLSSTRMLIGASSTIYMLISGITLYQIGIIKSMQAILILFLGFFIGVISDRFPRKTLHLIAVGLSSIWLFISFFAGIEKSFNLFLIAEIFNAISLAIFQNNSNAYLVDQYNIDSPQGNLSEAFGKLGKLDFFYMALFSLVGGFAYALMEKHIFLLAASIMLVIFIGSFIYLPRIIHKKNLKKQNFISKVEFLILARKFLNYKYYLFLFIILSLYFQVIIQYWQVSIYGFNIVTSNTFILGIVLFMMFIVQSIAGRCIEKNYNITETSLAIIFTLSALFCLIGEMYQSLTLYTLGLCFILFIARYQLIKTDAMLHSNLLSRFRAKYDMLLNSLVRIFTALVLILVGYLSELYGTQIINILGIAIGFTFILSTLIYKPR